jgi:hypothetical protein
MENHENMAPGQQNFPKAEKEENYKNALPGEQIISGAKQEDQLDQFKENAGQVDQTEPDSLKE